MEPIIYTVPYDTEPTYKDFIRQLNDIVENYDFVNGIKQTGNTDPVYRIWHLSMIADLAVVTPQMDEQYKKHVFDFLYRTDGHKGLPIRPRNAPYKVYEPRSSSLISKIKETLFSQLGKQDDQLGKLELPIDELIASIKEFAQEESILYVTADLVDYAKGLMGDKIKGYITSTASKGDSFIVLGKWDNEEGKLIGLNPYYHAWVKV